MNLNSNKRGFTLIELLVVIAIIAILASILFPIFAKARAKARQTTCTSNLRQLSMAVTMYCQDNKNRLPGIYKRQADGTVSTTYTGWAGDVITYVKGGTDVDTASEMMFCPETLSDIEMPISYGFNGCLLKSDGTGVNEAAIKQPTQVGVLCDVNPGVPMKAMSDTTPVPSTIFGGGGIVGGYSLLFSSTGGDSNKMGSKLSATPVGRHMGSVVVGYADGHAASVPDVNSFNPKDSLSGVVRAFYMCPALGLVDNPAAGLGGTKDNPFGNINTSIATTKTYTVIGGDPVTRPILMAACEVGKKMMKNGTASFTYSDDGFVGSLSGSTRPTDYMEGVLTTGSSAPTGPFTTNAVTGTNGITIGIDAMVVVVNKNCAINVAAGMSNNPMDLTKYSFSRVGGNGKWRVITLANLQDILASDGYGVITAGTGIAANHDWQVYLQGKDDGARATIAANAPNAGSIVSGATAGTGFARAVTTSNAGGFRDGGYTGEGTAYTARAGLNDADTYRGTYCANDMDIVDKVANDTLGIGIVSAAYADTKKVDILAINYINSAYGATVTTTTATFPSSNVRQDPGVYPPSCTWPFKRNMYAFRGDTTTASDAVSTFCFTGTYKPSFIAGPLYKASFWPF